MAVNMETVHYALGIRSQRTAITVATGLASVSSWSQNG